MIHSVECFGQVEGNGHRRLESSLGVEALGDMGDQWEEGRGGGAFRLKAVLIVRGG